MMYSMRGVIRQQPTIRSTCVCVCVCLCVCVCREADLCVHVQYSKHTPPPLKVQLHENTKQKSICVGVNMISNLILREGRYLGGRERRIHTHYHVTFHKIGGGDRIPDM